jgi:hypothetical protein
LQAELRDAERVVAEKARACNRWATRIVLEAGEALAEELAALRGRCEVLAAQLNGLAHCSFPSAGGPPDAPWLKSALSYSEPVARDAPWPTVEPHQKEWLQMHAAMMENPDA